MDRIAGAAADDRHHIRAEIYRRSCRHHHKPHLEKLLHENFTELGVPSHTAEEVAYTDALAKTYEGADTLPGIGCDYDAEYAAGVKTLRSENGRAMNDFLLPLYQGEAFRPGSTDVGDVSWECHTAQIHVAAWPNCCPGHSWQNVSCDRTAVGHKAAIHAGKVLCAAAIGSSKQPGNAGGGKGGIP